jgi:hypothetical protein
VKPCVLSAVQPERSKSSPNLLCEKSSAYDERVAAHSSSSLLLRSRGRDLSLSDTGAIGPHNTCTVQSASPSRAWSVHCFAIPPFNDDSRLLSRLRRPVGRFNIELLGVLRVQPRPTELHRLASNDAADGSYAEKPIQNIELFVGSKKETSRALRTRRRPSTSTPPVIYKSRDGRVLTSRSEHHRERVAKCLDASWIQAS